MSNEYKILFMLGNLSEAIEQIQTELKTVNTRLDKLENKVNTIEQASIRMEYQHGEKLQALYEGYISKEQSIKLKDEPRIANLEETVEQHSLEILTLKNTN